MTSFEEQDYDKSFDFSLWKKLLVFAKRYRKHLFLLLFVNIVIAIVDVLYPVMTRYAIDNLAKLEHFSAIIPFAAVYLCLAAVQCACVYIFIKMAGFVETSLVYDIRQVGFKRLQELSFSYFDKTPVGWIMARMTTDAQKIGDIIGWGLTDVVWAIGYLLLIIIFMMFINVKLALLALAAVPLLLIASLYFQQRILRGHREARKINSKITGAYNEGINGAKTTKTLIRENENFIEFQELSGSMRRTSIRVMTLNAVFMPIILSLSSIGISLVLWRGGIMALETAISVGTLALFLSYANTFFEPIRQIAAVFSEMQSAQASAERTMSLLETKPDIVDSPEVIKTFGTSMKPKRENWPEIEGEIEFKNVCFHYLPEEPILKDFNLKIKKGERIALVGETGSGKSTIVNLICRFYEPVSGSVLIDGVDYRERSQLWLQSNLGYVLQTPHLFSGTVSDNIRYGKLDATDEEVVEAAKTANAYDYIMRLENGFDTNAGEGGNRLSSGEKQLISFARAIIGSPKIFVLDEATSSIDTETEQIVQRTVDHILSGKTSIIVAHRLSTVRSCDKILVIDKGVIIESGTHKELIKKRGKYFNLYTNQFMEDQERMAFTDMTAER